MSVTRLSKRIGSTLVWVLAVVALTSIVGLLAFHEYASSAPASAEPAASTPMVDSRDPQLVSTPGIRSRASGTPTPTPTVVRVCQDLLQNGDFETGALPPWEAEGDVGLGIGRNSAHGAWLGGTNNAQGELRQRVLIPAGASSTYLRLWYMSETPSPQPGDWVDVIIQHGMEENTRISLLTRTPPELWRQHTVSMYRYAGQEVVIIFRVRTDNSTPAIFRVDDISVEDCRQPTCTPTATPTATPSGWQFLGNTLASGGMEPMPAPGVAVALFGSSRPDDLGQPLDTTQSSPDGSYTLSHADAAQAAARSAQQYPVFHIAVTDRQHRVVEATSGSGGEPAQQGWIRFRAPAPGEYGANDFLIDLDGGIIDRSFGGRLFRGEVGDRMQPWSDANVGLLKAQVACEEGLLVADISTDDLGRFQLLYSTPAEEDAPYYNVAVLDENIRVVGAESPSGASFTDQGWLQFAGIPAGEWAQNDLFALPVEGEQILPEVAADAYVSEQTPASNHGADAALLVSLSTPPDSRLESAFVYFDLSYLPADARVTKATLHLHLADAGGEEKACISVHPVLQDWCEGPICANIPPINWNKQPLYSSASAAHVVDLSEGWKTWDVTGLVQSWVDGSLPNHGAALTGPEEGSPWSRQFSSREGTVIPRLVVHLVTDSPYSTPTPTSTPTSTPTPTATPSLDLQIDHVELTQAIQCKDNPSCPDNSVPLIYGKTTFARVYVKVEGSSSPVADVSAQAITLVSGQSIPAMAINPTFTAQLSPSRELFGDTLNFYLHAISGSGTLEVEVNPNRTIGEADYSNNKTTLNLNYQATPPLIIVPIWLYYTKDGQNKIVDWNMPFHMSGYLRNILPVSEVLWHVPPNPVLKWDTTIETMEDWGTVLASVADLRKKNPSVTSAAHWYVMVPWHVPIGNISGLGSMPGKVAAGQTEYHHVNLEDTADIMAHELGHNLDRRHSPSGTTDDLDPSYPYPNADLGDTGWDPQFASGGKTSSWPDGYTVPATTADVMSYRQDEWISEYTYQGILSRRGSSPATAGLLTSSSPVTRQPYLFASGRIIAGQADLDPWSIMEQPAGFDDGTGDGPYRLTLVGPGGATLFERRFDLSRYVESWLDPEMEVAKAAADQPAASFYEILPYEQETTSIQLWEGDDLLVERQVSAHPPSVQFVSPQGGELWAADSEHLIDWQAEDEDGDELWFDLSFSRDGGETWQVLTTRLEERQVTVSASQLPGSSEAMLRVHASDGILTSSDTTDPFAIAPKPPQVAITAPQDGLAVPHGALLPLTGIGFDREDGMLEGESLSWHSDLDGHIGLGAEFVLNSFSAGRHTMTLTARDSDGLESSASVRILVGQQIYLPLLTRR